MAAVVSKRAQLLTGACLAAAALAPCTPASAQVASPFRPERFDDDWSDVSEANAPYGAQFKNIEIIDDITVSFGGDARWRFSYLDSPRLGIGTEADSWLLQRLLLHADLHFADHARAFVQVGAHDGIDRALPSASDDNQIDVQQAFFDIYAPLADGRLTFRLGRQELSLGPRFATTRDSVNVRQRHDLVRLIYAAGAWRADLFGGSPVVDERGSFDDEADVGQDFYGVRVQRAFAASTLDLYVYELDRDTATLTGVSANDDRVSLGARWTGHHGDLDYDSELVVQGGSFGGQDIRAAGATIDVGWRFPDAPMTPRIGARITYGSGDADRGDSTQGTFAPAFPSSQWFGQNGLGSFSNVIETAALFGASPLEDTTVNLKLSSVWRAETADLVYAGSGSLTDTSGGDDAFVGASLAASLSWRPNDNVTINPYVSFVAVGDELKTRGADDIIYAHLTISLRF
jgi:hypothetical protein